MRNIVRVQLQAELNEIPNIDSMIVLKATKETPEKHAPNNDVVNPQRAIAGYEQ